MEQLLDVFADDVDLDVDRIAGLQVGEVGDFPGLRDDGDFEVLVREGGDGQTDPFHRDRAFEDEVTRDLSRVTDSDGPSLPVILDIQELPARVDVALDDVTAEACGWCNGAFEIHGRAGFQTAECRAL